MFLDEVDGVETVFALSEEMDFGKTFKKEGELFASGFFVVDDDGGDRHRYRKYTAGAARQGSKGVRKTRRDERGRDGEGKSKGVEKQDGL